MAAHGVGRLSPMAVLVGVIPGAVHIVRRTPVADTSQAAEPPPFIDLETLREYSIADKLKASLEAPSCKTPQWS